MPLSYESVKELKDAGFYTNFKEGRGYYDENGDFGEGACSEYNHDIMPWLWVPTLDELVAAVMREVNELAIGYNDSGCFWHFQYGDHGAGNMIEGIGERFNALESDSLEEAVKELWLKLNPKQK